jgi:hypothetical protein
MRSLLRFTLVALLATPLLLAPGRHLHAAESGMNVEDALIEITEPGVAIHLDNDLFAGGGNDSDYSWGATLTWSSPDPAQVVSAVDGARRGLASLLPAREAFAISRASQVGVIAMTPDDLKARVVVSDDRPYASLAFLTSSELRVAETGDRSRFTSFTVGILGTGLAESLQKAVHHVQGGVVPNGWNHQVSDGGELTARFVLAEQWLLGDGETASGAVRQTKLTVGGSAGYLTEGSAAISMRWGRIRTPWWSFNPELGDYSPAPVAPASGYGLAAPETYAFAGARVKLRAYNALLQGQFRSSDLRIASDDLARLQAEVWAGVTHVLSDWQVTYALHAASREITARSADRSLVWASVSFSRAF